MPFIPAIFGTIVAISVITSAVIGVFTLFSAPKPGKISFGFQGDLGASPRYGNFGPLSNTISNELAVPILYGTLKIAGNIVWQSDPNTTVSRIVALCEGEISCIGDIRANDLLIEFGEDAPGCTASKYLGTATQETDSRVPAVNADGAMLGPNMNLRNLAYLAVTLVASEQLKGGDPTITSVNNGKLVETWDGNAWSSEKSFSRNPAAIIRDLLLNDRYGLGIPRANIDDAAFGAVYNYCSEIIGT